MVNTKQKQHFQPVIGPSAWYSEQFRNSTEWLVQLSEQHSKELRAALNLHNDMAEEDMHTLTANDFPLPTLGPVLRELRDELVDGRGFVAMVMDRLHALEPKCDGLQENADLKRAVSKCEDAQMFTLHVVPGGQYLYFSDDVGIFWRLNSMLGR